MTSRNHQFQNRRSWGLSVCASSTEARQQLEMCRCVDIGDQTERPRVLSPYSLRLSLNHDWKSLPPWPWLNPCPLVNIRQWRGKYTVEHLSTPRCNLLVALYRFFFSSLLSWSHWTEGAPLAEDQACYKKVILSVDHCITFQDFLNQIISFAQLTTWKLSLKCWLVYMRLV